MINLRQLFNNKAVSILIGAVIGSGTTTTVNNITEQPMPPVTYYVNNGSVHFYHWFNEYRKDNPTLFPHKIDSVGFVNVFNNINKFSYNRGSSMTLQEFLCYFFTMYNETGGLFKSISEIGDDGYFFEYRQIGIGWKRSYNIYPGNIPAGTYLYNLGIIRDSISLKQWNTTIYPLYAPAEIKMYARNCDFYKYRGQGLIQLTGRYNFDKFVKPLLPNVHELTWWQLQNEFKKPDIYLGSIRNYLSIHPNTIAKINKDIPEWDVFGHLISGKSKYHYFANRCDKLYNDIINEGFYRVFYPDIENAQSINQQDTLIQ